MLWGWEGSCGNLAEGCAINANGAANRTGPGRQYEDKEKVFKQSKFNWLVFALPILFEHKVNKCMLLC